MEETKKCIDCGRDLPLSSYAHTQDGHIYRMCRECESKRRSKGQVKRHEKMQTRKVGNRYFDPEFEGKTPREVQDVLARAARWLNNYGGFTCEVSLKYEKEITLPIR